jgi:RNA polymerase sigma factor (sigma-70 family)
MPTILNDAFQRHRRSLTWSVMRIVRDPQIAEDLAQETYVRAHKAIQAGPIEHIEAFLHQTARNLALDYLRRRKTRARVETDGLSNERLESIPADVPSLETEIIERERLRLFQAALATLPERVQRVVVLSRIEEWTNARIALHLGISERTVFNDLKLAMAHCRDALARSDRR